MENQRLLLENHQPGEGVGRRNDDGDIRGMWMKRHMDEIAFVSKAAMMFYFSIDCIRYYCKNNLPTTELATSMVTFRDNQLMFLGMYFLIYNTMVSNSAAGTTNLLPPIDRLFACAKKHRNGRVVWVFLLVWAYAGLIICPSLVICTIKKVGGRKLLSEGDHWTTYVDILWMIMGLWFYIVNTMAAFFPGVVPSFLEEIDKILVDQNDRSFIGLDRLLDRTGLFDIFVYTMWLMSSYYGPYHVYINTPELGGGFLDRVHCFLMFSFVTIILYLGQLDIEIDDDSNTDDGNSSSSKEETATTEDDHSDSSVGSEVVAMRA